MNRNLTLAAAIAAAALAAAGCDKPRTSTAYNNSGTDATAAQPAASGSPTVSTTVTTTSTDNASTSATTSSTATPDTASPSVASTAAPSSGSNSGSATGAVSETVTTGKIKAAIAADSAMKDTDISVTTKDGVVTLAGTVKSQDQISIATNLAQRQEGVQRVESNVTVR